MAISERTPSGPRPPSIMRSPRTVVASLTVGKAVRSAVIWGYIFGVSIASSAISYTMIYRTHAERSALATAFGSNNATSALFGPAPDLQTVGGFTVFKISMTLMVMGALWGLLTTTRLLRGEEDSGRWELLLTGQTTRRAAVVQALGGLGAGLVVLWAVTAVITIVTGQYSNVDFALGPSMYFALSMVATAVMFVAVGALTSQLGATRRQAASYASAFLGIAYAVRMVADAGVGLHGLIWVSPLGWVEELHPLTAPQPMAFVPIVVLTTVVAIIAVRLAGSRDVGASVIPEQAIGRNDMRLLSGPNALSIRMMRPTIIVWWVAIALSGLLYGLVAKSAGATISGSSVSKVFAKLGAPGDGTNAVLGVCFLILAVLVAFIAAGQLTMARSEEESGRLDHLLVRHVSRTSWLAGRVVLAIAVLLISGMIAGVFAWLGAISQGAPVSFRTLVVAGLNLVPPALAILGVGVLMLGVRPRMASIVVYAVLAWSLLLVIAGSIGTISHWILDTSVLHQMASAPAVSPHWEANGIMVAFGVATCILGGAAFRYRDLEAA